MKYLMFILLSLSTGLFFNDNGDGDYDKLWKKVFKNEGKLPKTAYGFVEQIYTLAIDEKRDDQLIKSIIYKLRLSSAFEDNNPADFLIIMEDELPQIQSNSGKALYCSIIGEMYSSYGMQNSYRFQNRSRVDNDENSESQNNDLPFKSLDEIQKKSVEYYKQSLSYRLDKKLEDFSLLTQELDSKGKVKASNLEQFLVFRALEHFKDTRSLVSLPKGSFAINSPALFDYDFQLANADLNGIPEDDYHLLGAALFQKAKALSKLDSEQKIYLEIMRLDYLNSHATVPAKESLYLSALEKLGAKYKGQKGFEAAYCKLISIYLDKGRSSRNDNTEEDRGYYLKAAGLIGELKKQSTDENYSSFIADLESRLTLVELDVKLEQVNPRNREFLGYLKYRNVSELGYQIYRLEGKDFEKYNQTHKPKDRVKFVKSLNSEVGGKLSLEQGADHEYHSIEFPLSGLTSGRYVLLTKHEATHKKNVEAGVVLSLFHVSDLSYISMNGWDNSEGFVVDRNSGKPLQGVKIEVSSQQYNQAIRRNIWNPVTTFSSDENGRFRYEGEGRSFSYKLVYGDDYLDLKENHYFNRRQKSRDSKQIQLFTDRAIYRPGQTIYYKGLVLNKDAAQLPTILAGEKVEVIFRDANWQIVKQETLTSDDYGTFHGILTAPEGSLTGRMQIEAKVEGRSFQQAIRVEEYKRPKLFAKIDKLSTAYALGDTVAISGSVKSFSGTTISEAKVQYRVEKQAARRWDYYWRGGQQGRTLEQVVSGIETVDSEGKFEIEFPTELGENAYTRYNYTAHFDITDATGESTTVIKKLMLSAVPFHLSIDMQENGFQGDLKDIQVKALNTENEEIEVRYEVKITELATPASIKRTKYWPAPELNYLDEDNYEQRFPLDAYGNEGDPSGWSTKAVAMELADSKLNTIGLKSLTPGAYKVELKAEDEKGNIQTEERYLFISPKQGAALPTQHLWTSELNDSYQPEEVVKLKVSTPYPQAHLLYRMRRGHDNLTTEWSRLKSGTEIEHKVTEQDRGGFTLDLVLVKNNRIYTEKFNIEVPWSNKQLQIEYATFRDKLTPGVEETWKLKVKDENGKPVSAELLAAMYDASLDQFVPHKWMKNFYPSYYAYGDWHGKGFALGRSYAYLARYRSERFHINGFWPELDHFGYNSISRRGGKEMWDEVTESSMGTRLEKRSLKSPAAPMMAQSAGAADMDAVQNESAEESMEAVTIEQEAPEKSFDELSLRENLNETVFFFPKLRVENGEVEFSYKMNEALTKWKLLLFAHSKELEYTFDTKEIVTQKQLMIEPHLPRFVRQGDKIIMTAKVTNLSEKAIQTTSKIQLVDAVSGDDLTSLLITDGEANAESLAPGKSSTVEWIFSIPAELNTPLIIKMMTEGGGHSDGEQNIVPVLTNRKLVTETLPLHLPGGSTKDFEMSGMDKMKTSKSLSNHNYTLELTTNPAWLVAKAIPYLTTPSKPSTQELFHVIYGNLLMQDLLENNPSIKETISNWKGKDLESNLSKNQELKLNTLEETPWVREAQSEEEQMTQLKVFLDNNYVTNQLSDAAAKLQQRQLGNGGFSWMPGGRDNWYITQNILEGIGKLNKLGIETGLTAEISSAAVAYIDKRIIEHYEDNRGAKKSYIEPLAIHYLYVRSFFKDSPIKGKLAKVHAHYFSKGEKYWQDQGSYQQGLLAMAAARFGKPDLASSIMASLKERMIKNEELGNYWNDQAGYYWYNLNIEKQALMIELFQELKGSQEDIDGLKLWLLKTKQTNSWKTSKATSAACYAFLLGTENWLSSSEEITLEFPLEKKAIEFGAQEYATGYVKKVYPATDISTTKKKITAHNPNEGVAWGAVYWQYFEELDKIENYQDTPLKLVKEVYRVGVDDSGEILQKISADNQLVPGDRLRIRISLQVDRPMEFIEMKDMRSSGLAPTNVLSSYKWQDGLSYYESTKDLATYFYFDFLPKGNWVFEYDVKAGHRGSFSNGITEIQSMYAPEFSSHSNGVEITVTKE